MEYRHIRQKPAMFQCSRVNVLSERCLTDALPSTPSNDALKQGIAAYREGHKTLASGYFSLAISRDRSNANAWLASGAFELAEKEYTLSMTYTTMAIHLAPKEAIGYYQRAVALLGFRRFRTDAGFTGWSAIDTADAMQDLDKAIALDPGFAEAHLQMWKARHRLRDYGEALASLEAYCRLVPWDGPMSLELERYRVNMRYMYYYYQYTPSPHNRIQRQDLDQNP